MSTKPTPGAIRAASLIRPFHGFKAIPDDMSLLIGEAQIIERETGMLELLSALEDVASRAALLRADLDIDAVSHADHMRRLWKIGDVALTALAKAKGTQQ